MISELINNNQFIFIFFLGMLGILLVLCLVRACMGPTVADRLVAVNMMGTMVIVIIGTLTVVMQEGYLADICFIYAAVSVLATILLSKVIEGVYKEKREKDREEK